MKDQHFFSMEAKWAAFDMWITGKNYEDAIESPEQSQEVLDDTISLTPEEVEKSYQKLVEKLKMKGLWKDGKES